MEYEAYPIVNIDHPYFNRDAYMSGVNHIIKYAKPHGLVMETLTFYNEYIELAFEGTNYPKDEQGYIQEANDALYCWDI